MSNRYFQVTQGGIKQGTHKLNTGSSGVYRGMLSGWPSGGSLGTSTGSTPYGQFYDFLRLEEHPTTQDLGSFLDGKEVNVVTGKFYCLVGPDLFASGSIAAVGSKLYPGTAGLLDTNQNWSGVETIGKVAAHVTVADAGGAGSFDAAHCIMEFPIY